MGMMHHHRSNDFSGMVGLVLAVVGLLVLAAIVYELFMNRRWIVEHIPPEVKQAMPEPVTKALEQV